MRYGLLLVCATLLAQTTPSVEKEKALGAQIAAEYRRQGHMIDAASVNRYLDDLGQRLAAHAPATGFPYTFELVDDDQTWVHEAAAFPGGPVFVPAGLILAAADEDELAGMLAHAIAHIATRQETRQMTRGQIPRIVMGGWQAGMVPLAFRAVQRQNELESDQLAVRILSSAGYDPQALARYIERVQPADPPLRNDKLPYPDKDYRLAALQAAIGQLPPAKYSTHTGLDAIHQDVTRSIVQPGLRPAKSPPRLAR